MSRKRIGEPQDSNNYGDYDSLFSVWQNSDFDRRNDFGLADNYYDRNSIFGSQAFSMKPTERNSSRVQQNKDVNLVLNGITPQDTISLTDMIKTNCSREEISNIVRIRDFQKPSLASRGHDHQPGTNEDDLQHVSNRKLQNRFHSKRARERKKEQWKEMKDLIEDLKSQNKMLKNTIKSRAISNNKENQGQKNWSYCKRCQKQIFNDQFISYINSSEQKNQKIINLKQNFEMDKECCRESEDENLFSIKKGSNAQQKNSFTSMDDIQPEFQQINFGAMNNKKPIKNQRQRNWTSKMWLALSILMLVIGLQIHGLQGSGEKCIRVNQNQTKKWISELMDDEVRELTVKMKTKIPFDIVQNQKLTESKRFKDQKLKQKWKSVFSDRDEDEMKKLQSSVIAFSSEQMYAQEFINQQQTQVQISKDLLFSIQAEFDDIGRYI